MNREDIIRMVREVADKDKVDPYSNGFVVLTPEEMERFATIIVAAEREACARLCDQMFHDWCNQEFEDEDEAYRNKPDAEDCKKAIRARGNT